MTQQASPAGPGLEIIQARGLSVGVTAKGSFTLDLRDMRGKILATHNGQGQMRVTLEKLHEPGIYFVTATSQEGRTTRKFFVTHTLED